MFRLDTIFELRVAVSHRFKKQKEERPPCDGGRSLLLDGFPECLDQVAGVIEGLERITSLPSFLLRPMK
jgi:hypothetical protein